MKENLYELLSTDYTDRKQFEKYLKTQENCFVGWVDTYNDEQGTINVLPALQNEIITAEGTTAYKNKTFLLNVWVIANTLNREPQRGDKCVCFVLDEKSNNFFKAKFDSTLPLEQQTSVNTSKAYKSKSNCVAIIVNKDYVKGGVSSIEWGKIIGTITDQTDLVEYLTSNFANKTDVEDLTQEVADNSTQIATNTSDISTLKTSKQDTLTFDTTPKSGSTNPVTSGGIYTALSGKQNTLTTTQLNAVNSGITSDLVAQISTNKTNIATNASDISDLQTSVATNTSDISTNTSNIATNTSNISSLQSSVSSISGDYVTRTTTQTISGAKTFSKGVVINKTDTWGLINHGTAGSNSIMTRGIVGNAGGTSSDIADLYINYGYNDYKTYFNNTNTYINTTASRLNGTLTVGGNTTIGGNLTVNGTTTTVSSTTLQVKDKLIEVAYGNTEALTTPAGLVAPLYDGTNSGGLVFDSTGTAYVGDITLDDSGNISVADSDLQPLTTRGDLVDGNLIQWDATNLTLVDSGKAIGDLATTSDLASKQDTLTFDTTPTSGSSNPVTSGGIYTALGDYLTKSNPTGTGSLSLNRKADTTIGDYSVAVGYNTTASGYVSHAEGWLTTASGQVSHAEGLHTTANSESQHVFGEYNVLDTNTTTTARGTYVEIVGNGTSSARSNARTLDWSGNEWLAGGLTVGNKWSVTVNSSGELVFSV